MKDLLATIDKNIKIIKYRENIHKDLERYPLKFISKSNTDGLIVTVRISKSNSFWDGTIYSVKIWVETLRYRDSQNNSSLSASECLYKKYKYRSYEKMTAALMPLKLKYDLELTHD